MPCGSTPTTRSSWGRTGRRTSRSSKLRRAPASSPALRSSARPTCSRRRRRGRSAMTRKQGPTAFSLTRQKLSRTSSATPASILGKTALRRRLRGAGGGRWGSQTSSFIASGSEVHLAVGARERLEAQGKKVRMRERALTSETFAKQDAAYQRLGPPQGVRRVSLDPKRGRTDPWKGLGGRRTASRSGSTSLRRERAGQGPRAASSASRSTVTWRRSRRHG